MQTRAELRTSGLFIRFKAVFSRVLLHRSGLFIALALLNVASSPTPIPGFSPRTLVHDSELIVVGTIAYNRSIARTATFAGSDVPAKEFFADIAADRRLKGFLDSPLHIQVHWTQPMPTWGTAGYSSPPDGSYAIFFLKADKLTDAYTFTSGYYPSVPARRSVPEKEAEQSRSDDDHISHEVIQEMCWFIEDEEAYPPDRVHALWDLGLSATNDTALHQTAVGLAHGPQAELRDLALTALLRGKDASFLPLAKKEIILAANNGASGYATGIILAITQEFPGDESVLIIKSAATTTNIDLRRTIALAARYTRSASAIPMLLRLIDDPNDPDRQIAWNAMHSLGELTGHWDWRPKSQEPAEWQRCLRLWHDYAATVTSK